MLPVKRRKNEAVLFRGIITSITLCLLSLRVYLKAFSISPFCLFSLRGFVLLDVLYILLTRVQRFHVLSETLSVSLPPL
jgi:hypothetical protein